MTLSSTLLAVNNSMNINGATTCASTLTIASTTIVGNNNSNPNLQLGSINGNNYSIASSSGAFSSSYGLHGVRGTEWWPLNPWLG